MNRRTFLLGLGVGIILGAGLLQLMLIGEKQAEGLDALPESSVGAKTYTQAELDQAVSAESERVQSELQKKPVSSNPAGNPEKTDKPAAEASSKSDTKPAASGDGAAESEPARIIVRIPPNASVSDTAELLAGRGIIPDKEAFIDLMRTKTIRAGYFAFQGKLSLQQVRGIVTGEPLDPEAAKSEMAAGQG